MKERHKGILNHVDLLPLPGDWCHSETSKLFPTRDLKGIILDNAGNQVSVLWRWEINIKKKQVHTGQQTMQSPHSLLCLRYLGVSDSCEWWGTHLWWAKDGTWALESKWNCLLLTKMYFMGGCASTANYLFCFGTRNNSLGYLPLEG